MDANEERRRLQEEIARFDRYFVAVRSSPMPKALSEHAAQTGFTPEDEAFLSRSACQLYQRCAVGRFAEELLEDALTCGAPGERTAQRLHRFLEQYTDLLEQEYGWC